MSQLELRQAILHAYCSPKATEPELDLLGRAIDKYDATKASFSAKVKRIAHAVLVLEKNPKAALLIGGAA